MARFGQTILTSDTESYERSAAANPETVVLRRLEGPTGRAARFWETGGELRVYNAEYMDLIHHEKSYLNPAIYLSSGYRNDRRFAEWGELHGTNPHRLFVRFAISFNVEWEVRRIRPEPELYVPVLQMADTEKVLPAPANIWSVVMGRKDATPPSGSQDLPAQQQQPVITSNRDEQMLFRNYLAMQRSQPLCGIYHRVLSYPGTWLFQFWLYYPFDYGGVSSHLHFGAWQE